jgi:hypothetical protein
MKTTSVGTLSSGGIARSGREALATDAVAGSSGAPPEVDAHARSSGAKLKTVVRKNRRMLEVAWRVTDFI